MFYIYNIFIISLPFYLVSEKGWSNWTLLWILILTASKKDDSDDDKTS